MSRDPARMVVMGPERIKMARVLRHGEQDDGSFDLEFWQAVGAEGIFSASWEMVGEVQDMRGEDGDQPGFQRSAVRIIRRES